MFNKDYIMRMIEQLVQGIALIMGLKQENRLEESADLLSDTLRKFYGLNDQSIDNLPWRDLMSVASLGGLPDAEKCTLLAQLIKEKGDLDMLQGKKELAAELYMKALNIYTTALLVDHYFCTAEHQGKINEMIVLTEQAGLPDESRNLLFGYYELVGKYGKAEDMLYELLEQAEDWETVMEQGRAFYHRLLAMGDDELAMGNLPRNELQDGLENLEDFNHPISNE